MPSDTKALDVVLVEAKLMGDLIVVNLSEDYNLLTVQVLMGFIWVHNNCQGVKYVLKMDDDTYANLFNLEQYILRTENQKPAKVSNQHLSEAGYNIKCYELAMGHLSYSIDTSRSQLCSHTPSTLNAGAKRSGATCHMAMPQYC